MKIEVAEHGRMSESGSSLLRLIQNQDMPLLDLFVRESVQNSLDAAASDVEYVNVDMVTGTFKPAALNRHLEKIEDRLNRRYSSVSQNFIAVRDSNTIGLTGPVRYKDVRNNSFGNLLKLVYEICKPQSTEGAGGSWGLGKTIYFRLGIGLVLYYSRIRQNGKYQSRLVACLVEDETKKEALIPHAGGVKRGIAWWGKRDGLVAGSTIPVDNELEIVKILSIFGLSPYTQSETGTTIIIPYIDEKVLLNEVYAINEPAESKPYWVGGIADYLNIALQRWYSPRLNNISYPYGAYLSASVNGTKVKISGMLSLFRYVRELYILATTGTLESESLIESAGISWFVESIDLRGVLSSTSSGKFAYAKFNRRQLQMEPPSNERSPYQQILNIAVQMEGGNGPIVMYTRRPGMIVGYDYDGTWTHRMPKSAPDEFILGLFVANSQNTLKSIVDPKTGSLMSLEEYIRQGEKADHASWSDRNIAGNNFRIISNIQKHVISKIKKKYSEPVRETFERQNTGLAHALADMLLPQSDFGTDASVPPNPNNGGRGQRPIHARKSTFRIFGNPQYSNGSVEYEFEIVMKGKPCILSLQVLTDFKRYQADSWEKEDEIGKPFPLEFKELTITHIRKAAEKSCVGYDCNILITGSARGGNNKDVSVEFLKSSRFSTLGYAHFVPSESGCIITGNLVFSFSDPALKGMCELKETDK